MKFIALADVRHLVAVGAPLPFGVRDADATLLLARGQRLLSSAQLDALLDRGAVVDDAEVAPLQNADGGAASVHRWSLAFNRVQQALTQARQGEFRQALEDASRPLLTLVESDPDLAIFQIVRRQGGADVAYGVQRSMNTAVASYLVAQRMGWDAADAEKAFKVALTMNVSMLALQGVLATQATPPSVAQREALASHPLRSMQMLEAAGVRDADWLNAVLRHHENEEGTGYPSGCREVGELATLVRRADQYTAKLASRARREALSADVAGRQMFMDDPGHPMTAALVKEFGIYPPGSFVRLASGATAVVVARGDSLTSPVLACLSDEHGRPLPAPSRRHAAPGPDAVVAVVGEGALGFRIAAEQLMVMTRR